jgi:hypothetical protein
MTRILGAALLACLVPIAASAQTSDASPALDLSAAQASQGPMTVQRIHNGFLAAPDFKITDFDHRTSGLMGGYAGVVFADAVFIGGGGYGLVTDTQGRSLGYGGLILQWFGRPTETLAFSAKMLTGWGEAETTEAFQVVDNRGRATVQAARVHQDFYVFEPEVNGLVRFSRNLRLAVGAGYRFTGNGWYHNNYYYGYPANTSPSGWTASVGMQIGGGS